MTDAFTPSHRGGSGEPMLLLHGFTDTWRTWDLVREDLEHRHDVLAVTLPGHAGGPPIEGEISDTALVDQLEGMLDEVGWETAHIVGNSLGGYAALHLAARGRATSVVALAPAGGWAIGDDSYQNTLGHFSTMQELLKSAAEYADAIVASPEGRRQSTQIFATNYEHIPADLIAHLIRGAAACEAAGPLIEYARREGWKLEPEKITCPVRIVWGTSDLLLLWPSAAARFQAELPNADWVELEGVGHCIQLDVPLETVQLILGFTG